MPGKSDRRARSAGRGPSSGAPRYRVKKPRKTAKNGVEVSIIETSGCAKDDVEFSNTETSRCAKDRVAVSITEAPGRAKDNVEKLAVEGYTPPTNGYGNVSKNHGFQRAL